jgi:hypothetical protein
MRDFGSRTFTAATTGASVPVGVPWSPAGNDFGILEASPPGATP